MADLGIHRGLPYEGSQFLGEVVGRRRPELRRRRLTRARRSMPQRYAGPDVVHAEQVAASQRGRRDPIFVSASARTRPG